MMVNMIRLSLLVPLLFVISCTNPRADWKECDQSVHPHLIKGSYTSSIIGSVTMVNGERCDIEEVSRITQNFCDDSIPGQSSYEYDEQLRCKYCGTYKLAVSRRLICSGGSVHTNTISDDGTKFHNEVIY